MIDDREDKGPLGLPFISTATYAYDQAGEAVVKEFSVSFHGLRVEGKIPLMLLPCDNLQLVKLCLSFVTPLHRLGLSNLTLKLHVCDHTHWGWIPGGSEQCGNLDLIATDFLKNETLVRKIHEDLNAVSLFITLPLGNEEREFIVKNNYTVDEQLGNVVHALGTILRDLPPNLRPG